MREIFNFITMMLINHISNMHSSRFLKDNCIFFYFFGCPNLYKKVKVDELLNIFHFQHNVVLKCTCKFSAFKYYSRMHQMSNGKVGLLQFDQSFSNIFVIYFYFTKVFQIL
jgi:hypothetical protein